LPATAPAQPPLRSLGVRIALDDLGTGYSSLGYLRSFPFDKPRIDRSCVEDPGTSTNGHAIIRAITPLTDALGMERLAERAEDIARFKVLEREGCRHIQGDLSSRPVAADAVAGLLRNGAGLEQQLRTWWAIAGPIAGRAARGNFLWASGGTLLEARPCLRSTVSQCGLAAEPFLIAPALQCRLARVWA